VKKRGLETAIFSAVGIVGFGGVGQDSRGFRSVDVPTLKKKNRANLNLVRYAEGWNLLHSVTGKWGKSRARSGNEKWGKPRISSVTILSLGEAGLVADTRPPTASSPAGGIGGGGHAKSKEDRAVCCSCGGGNGDHLISN